MQEPPCCVERRTHRRCTFTCAPSKLACLASPDACLAAICLPAENVLTVQGCMLGTDCEREKLGMGGMGGSGKGLEERQGGAAWQSLGSFSKWGELRTSRVRMGHTRDATGGPRTAMPDGWAGLTARAHVVLRWSCCACCARYALASSLTASREFSWDDTSSIAAFSCAILSARFCLVTCGRWGG